MRDRRAGLPVVHVPARPAPRRSCREWWKRRVGFVSAMGALGAVRGYNTEIAKVNVLVPAPTPKPCPTRLGVRTPRLKARPTTTTASPAPPHGRSPPTLHAPLQRRHCNRAWILRQQLPPYSMPSSTTAVRMHCPPSPRGRPCPTMAPRIACVAVGVAGDFAARAVTSLYAPTHGQAAAR